jgi:hypothetical protein
VKLPHNWKWKFIFQSASDTIALTFFRVSGLLVMSAADLPLKIHG